MIRSDKNHAWTRAWALLRETVQKNIGKTRLYTRLGAIEENVSASTVHIMPLHALGRRLTPLFLSTKFWIKRLQICVLADHKPVFPLAFRRLHRVISRVQNFVLIHIPWLWDAYAERSGYSKRLFSEWHRR